MTCGDVVRLRGIAWNHTRGFVPMVATAQRFAETHPGVEVVWEKRSLQAFADYPVDKLAEEYDLLVLDHPWTGFAARRGLLLAFDDHLPPEFMQDQRENQVGVSAESYVEGGKQWALAIDAATPVASYRPDLLEREGVPVPRTWEELIALARRGRVVMSGLPIDMLSHFNMFCLALGEEPYTRPDEVVSKEVGAGALEELRRLASYQTPEIFDWNPIRVYEAMTSRDDFAYCFSAYGYSNYARPRYAPKLLRFTTMVSYSGGVTFRSTLGGAGLAVSARSRAKEVALEYARYVASPECQKGVYVESGGQPGHRAAWLDERANQLTSNYFRDTLPELDRAFLRPRYDGFMHYQDRACIPLWHYVKEGGSAQAALEAMNRYYRESRGIAP